MMIIESWVLWTLLAAVMQSVRTAGQKFLSGDISAMAATTVRYLFGLPFAVIYLLVLTSEGETLVPNLNLTFLASGFVAGILQIVATVLLIKLFALRNFAVGSTYARTEVMLTAVIGFVFFAEAITGTGWVAIMMCVAGVLVISVAKTGAIRSLWDKSALYGLGAGISFALTSLLIRRASLSFGIDDWLLTAAMTLCYMVSVQTLITVAYLALMQPEQFALIAAKWRLCLFVGVTSIIGSAGWFTAMTLELASYVKTLGQVEFLITLAIGWFVFKERPSRLELLGMVMIVVAVVVLLIYP